MQFTTATIVAFLAAASTGFAAPTAGPAGQWTIEQFKRVCPSTSECTTSFTIDLNDGSPATAFSYKFDHADAEYTTWPQDQTQNGITVGSGWASLNNAPHGNGWTTFGISHNKQIIYPSFTDQQLANGAVQPDQSIAPQAAWGT